MSEATTNHDVVKIITPEGKTAELPVIRAVMGPPTFDIKTLHKQTGYFTYDSGFAATGACKSDITFIDGEKGVLLYRGYPIEQLAQNSSFMEVTYLLMNGELPNQQQYQDFNHLITRHTMVHEKIRSFMEGFQYDAHPMAMMMSGLFIMMV